MMSILLIYIIAFKMKYCINTHFCPKFMISCDMFNFCYEGISLYSILLSLKSI